jgi:hypothetical protein
MLSPRSWGRERMAHGPVQRDILALLLKRCWGLKVWQVSGCEFKPQYCLKKTKKKRSNTGHLLAGCGGQWEGELEEGS